MRKSINMFYVVTLSTRPGEAQGWEGAQLLFKAKGGSSHVAARSFFCLDLPLLSDRRARGTSKHRWQALRQRGARCAHLACTGLSHLHARPGDTSQYKCMCEARAASPAPTLFFRHLRWEGWQQRAASAASGPAASAARSSAWPRWRC